MTDYFRITVEDLATGDKQVVEVAEGDFILIPFGGCYLGSANVHANGTVQLTVKNHRPAGPKREATS